MKRLLKLKLNWADLQKDDKLYILVPEYDSDGDIIYNEQESNIISIKCSENKYKDKYVKIRFKYTLNNKRIREDIQIFNSSIGNPYFALEIVYPKKDKQYGKTFITHDQNELHNLHIKLIDNEITRLESNIKQTKEQIKKLYCKRYEIL